MENDLVDRLLTRARIRRSIPRAKPGESDRISDILEEAAAKIIELSKCTAVKEHQWAAPVLVAENDEESTYMIECKECEHSYMKSQPSEEPIQVPIV